MVVGVQVVTVRVVLVMAAVSCLDLLTLLVNSCGCHDLHVAGADSCS